MNVISHRPQAATSRQPWGPPSQTQTQAQAPAGDQFQRSEPSLLYSAWQGAKTGTKWTSVTLAVLAMAGDIKAGRVDPQALLEVALGAPILGAVIGGPVGALVGGTRHAWTHRS